MDIRIPLQGFDNIYINGELVIANASKGLIIFAHGSGSSGRASPRNQYVANVLYQNGFATVLVDLLTTQEQESDSKSQNLLDKYPSLALNKFNIGLLASRLETVTTWLLENVSEVKDLPIGFFGSSTGAAATIEASIYDTMIGKVNAIVSRGGRPDLANKESLRNIKSPILLIVGQKDSKQVIELNKKAFGQLKRAKSKELVMIPNTGHLFEEKGALEEVSKTATKWFIEFVNAKKIG
jgi:dienelactone hydrolase